MQEKLAIIVPYRDRESHRKVFIPNIKAHLKNVNVLNYSIYFIEQEEGKLFNRGKILNCGYDILKSQFIKFCIHDIDMIPISDSCDYILEENAVHLSNHISQFNNIYQEKYYGGVWLFNKSHFEKINGFYNNFWGWGAEDDDFGLRLERNNIVFIKKHGYYKSLYHVPNGDALGGYPNMPTKDYILKNRETLNKHKNDLRYNGNNDGLNTLEYKVIESKTLEENVFIYKVSI